MSKPPEKEAPGLGGTWRKTNKTSELYHYYRGLQAQLERRLNRPASIAELLPAVLITTLLQRRASR